MANVRFVEMDGGSEGPQMELAGKTQDIDLPGCSKDFFWQVKEERAPSGWSSKSGEEMAHLVNAAKSDPRTTMVGDDLFLD